MHDKFTISDEFVAVEDIAEFREDGKFKPQGAYQYEVYNLGGTDLFIGFNGKELGPLTSPARVFFFGEPNIRKVRELQIRFTGGAGLAQIVYTRILPNKNEDTNVRPS